MKKSMAMAAAAILALSLAGCSGQGSEPEETSAASVETAAETEPLPAPEGAGRRRLPRWALAGLAALLCLLAVTLAYYLGTMQGDASQTIKGASPFNFRQKNIIQA